ncbi:TPA: hypothetical protein I9Y37_000975 [Citrobacter freundii]|nr:hypothetical protein [Citrobacter freundii]HAT3962963.1 hypothetical protein [Citrobacter freundii]
MGSNIIELVKLGHERAAELKSSCGAVDVRSVAQLISDLATQLEVQLARGNAQAVQLANAESKCRALAVDNASLKNPENWLLQSDYGYEASEVATQNGATEDESLRAGMIAIINRIVTPATDAFLAEVRAQGLERLAKAWYAIANETASGISISESSRLKYRQRADDVADFANEIRKEAAQ